MLAAPLHRKLVPRAGEHRIEGAGLDHDRRNTAANPTHIPEELSGLPGLSVLELVGVGPRVGCSTKPFSCQDPRRLVVAVAIGGRSRKDRNNEVRAKRPNHPDDVAQQFVSRPVAKRLVRAL